MGYNLKKLRGMTPEGQRKAMRNIMRLHAGIALAGYAGMMMLAATAAVLAALYVMA